MEGRRTRGRPKRLEDSVTGNTSKSAPSNTQNSPGTVTIIPMTVERGSPPPRNRRASPPVRRSSRPRSTTLGTSASSATITLPSPIKEAKETKTVPKQQRIGGRAGTTNTTTTTTAPTNKISPKPGGGGASTTTSSSVHSTYSSTTAKTVEIRSSSGGGIGGTATLDNSELRKLSDYIRRSVSKTIAGVREATNTPTHTDTESRYSRSVSRSLYEDDGYSRAEFSDGDDDDGRATNGGGGEELDADDEHYKSFSVSGGGGQPLLVGSSATLLCRKLAPPQEYGGRFGALALMLLAPCIVYYLQWSCGKVTPKTTPESADSCTLRVLNVLGALDANYLMRRVFQPEAVGAYVAFVLGIFVLSAVLPGKRVRLPLERGSLTYKFNAPAMTLLLSGALGAAIYHQYPVLAYVQRHYLRFCIYGFMSAVIVSQWAYFRASEYLARKLQMQSTDPDVQANVYGKTGDIIIDYAQGRQINPKWLGRVEFKLVFQRVALLGALLFAQCLIYRSVLISDPLPDAVTEALAAAPRAPHTIWLLACHYAGRDGATLLSAGMLLLYTADALLFEHHLASSFELQGEGFGCLLLLRYAATPFLLSAVAKYMSEQKIAIGCQWAVYGPVALLVVGLMLKRFSNAIKYQYRLNPTLPIFHRIETIHTFQGRRLLLGALWGRLRQPNYAGDILALIALALPLSLRFAWPPLLSVLLCVALLLHRTVRVNTRNLARYHSSWVRYCAQVRSYIVPKIY